MNLEEFLKTEYGLPGPIRIDPFLRGFLTENSLVETATGTRYFLKKQRESVASKIGFVESTEIFFYEHGIPVILPIKNKQGGSHAIFQNETFTLYPMIEGGIQPEREDLTDGQLESLARTLAKMHIEASKLEQQENREQGMRWNSEKSLMKINEIETVISKSDGHDLNDFDRLCLESLQLKQDFISSNKKEPGDFMMSRPILTHGDFQDQNVFFDSNEQITHIFDFEKAEIAARETELVRALLLICFNHRYTEHEFKKAELFIGTYNREHPIQTDEFRSALEAHVIKAFHSTWIEGEHYLQNNARVDCFMQGNTNTLIYMKNNLEFFTERMLSLLP